jgi:hypothetical protein
LLRPLFRPKLGPRLAYCRCQLWVVMRWWQWCFVFVLLPSRRKRRMASLIPLEKTA